MRIFDLMRHTALHDLLKNYKLNAFKNLVSKTFPNNKLNVNSIFPIEILSVGKYSYGDINIVTFSNKSHLNIGNFVSIAQNVHFLLDAEHNIDTLSTFPYKVFILGNEAEAFSKGDIIIDDDVWIGYGATVMSGVHIGQGAVIAAGAIVTKDVDPYTIVGGIPARFIKKRFNNDVIEELLKIDFGKLDDNLIKNHIDDLYETITDKKQIQWMPKK